LRKLKRKRKLQLSLLTSRVEKLTILVLLNQRRIICLDSKAMRSSKAEAEVVEEEVHKVVPEEEAEVASRICKLMNLNSPLYEEARVKSTFDKRSKERRDLQI
jgi:hypothetical protein